MSGGVHFDRPPQAVRCLNKASQGSAACINARGGRGKGKHNASAAHWPSRRPPCGVRPIDRTAATAHQADLHLAPPAHSNCSLFASSPAQGLLPDWRDRRARAGLRPGALPGRLQALHRVSEHERGWQRGGMNACAADCCPASRPGGSLLVRPGSSRRVRAQPDSRQLTAADTLSLPRLNPCCPPPPLPQGRPPGHGRRPAAGLVHHGGWVQKWGVRGCCAGTDGGAGCLPIGPAASGPRSCQLGTPPLFPC